MPRVFLTKQDQLQDRLVKLIYGTMKVKKISQTLMADKLGITQPAFAYKLRTKKFSHPELVTIFEVLESTDEEMLSVLRLR